VTISSLTSVSADGEQPSLLACIHRQSPGRQAILQNRAFCANLLAEDQQDIANLFRRPRRGRTMGSASHKDMGAGDLGPAPAGRGHRHLRMPPRHGPVVGDASHHRRASAAVRLSDAPSALLYGQRAYRRAVHLPKGVKPLRRGVRLAPQNQGNRQQDRTSPTNKEWTMTEIHRKAGRTGFAAIRWGFWPSPSW
jgi:flavin reductase